MNSQSPEVTVVIPTRNRWGFLERTLRTVLAQEAVHFEIVVIDDGSTDETASRLNALGDDRVRVFLGASAGVAPARNRGIEEARGEWVAFLDDDDLWAPDKLGAQLAVARSRDADFVYSAAVEIAENGDFLSAQPAPVPSTLYVRLLERNIMPAGASNMMVRREFLEVVGGFDEQLFQLADWDMWIRLSAAGRPAAAADALVAYVKHTANMLVIHEHDAFDELDYLTEKHAAAAEATGVSFDRVSFSRWVAVEHVRRGDRLKAARVFLTAARAHRNPGNVFHAARAVVGGRPDYMRFEGGNHLRPAWLDTV